MPLNEVALVKSVLILAESPGCDGHVVLVGLQDDCAAIAEL